MRFLTSFLAAMLISSVTSSNAADSDAIVVTATRTAQTTDETLASVSVITRNDIERSQAQSISELLTGVIGIDSTNYGGPGQVTSLFLRGTNAGHVLVLIDGIRVGSATLGSTSFEFLPLSQIERIEVVRGPLSSLYGSEAIGGVIQIFTRKGQNESAAHVEVGGGSYNTRSASAGMSSSKDGTAINMTAARFTTGGFSACKGSLDGACYTVEPDKDGYTNDSITARFNHRFDDNTGIGAHVFRAQGHTNYDGSYQNNTNFIQQAVGADLDFSPVSAWQIKLRAGQSQDNNDYFKNKTFTSNVDSQRNTVSWQNDLTLGKNKILTLGLDRQEDHVISSTTYTTDRRNDKGIFGQIQNKLDNQDFLLALRRDDNDAFGKYNTGNAAWGYALSNALRLTASYGTAFKTPTFNQLYWPAETTSYFGTTYISSGNPNVRPEESRTGEIGVNYRPAERIHLNINTYKTDVKNLIDWNTSQTAPNTFTTMPENISHARINGVEAQLNLNGVGWATNIAYTWVDPRDVSTGHILPRRSKQSLKFDADRTFGKSRFGLSWLAQGKRFDDKDNKVTMGGYGLLSLRTEYDLSKEWLLRARIDNAFDKEYETAHDYNTPGRGLYASINYQMR